MHIAVEVEVEALIVQSYRRCSYCGNSFSRGIPAAELRRWAFTLLDCTMATGVVRRAGALVLFDVTNVDVGTVGTSGTASSTTRLDCPTAAIRSHDVSWSVCLQSLDPWRDIGD